MDAAVHTPVDASGSHDSGMEHPIDRLDAGSSCRVSGSVGGRRYALTYGFAFRGAARLDICVASHAFLHPCNTDELSVDRDVLVFETNFLDPANGSATLHHIRNGRLTRESATRIDVTNLESFPELHVSADFNDGSLEGCVNAATETPYDHCSFLADCGANRACAAPFGHYSTAACLPECELATGICPLPTQRCSAKAQGLRVAIPRDLGVCAQLCGRQDDPRCPAGQLCVDNVCITDRCSLDSRGLAHCPAGYACSAGRCVAEL